MNGSLVLITQRAERRSAVRYNSDSCAVELTARRLCELALSRGNLDDLPLGYSELRADDKELFFRIQSEAGAYYNPRMPLCNTASVGDIYVTVSAEADGIIRDGTGAIVDKIKCVRGKNFYAPVDDLTLAMLKCSAYFFCVKESLGQVRGRVSYYNVDTKKFKYFKYRFSIEELKSFYYGLLEKIRFRASLLVKRATEELPQTEQAVFPYGELREGQEWMIRDCYSAIKRGKRIFVEAPTGIGKTVSALFSAARALGRGYCDKIFYLTPKTATRREAYRAAAKLCEGGAKLRTVIITAKEQICPCGMRMTENGENPCSSKNCEYARGYYDRADRAIEEIIDGGKGYPRTLIAQTAAKYRVCPYELSLDLSELCDIVICDYNYAFDPAVYFRRYFSGDTGEKYVFLIDEAHNLADRARDMYSAELKRSSFESILSRLDERMAGDGEIVRPLEAVIASFGCIKKLCRDDLVKDENGNYRGFYMSHSPIEALAKSLDSFRRKCDAFVKKEPKHPIIPILLPLLAEVRKYLLVCEYFDESFLCMAQLLDGDASVKIYCLDPSNIMNMLLSRASASVMFSATLTPTEYFRDVLGGGKNAETLTLPSPFCSDNLCVAVADYVNTRFDERDGNAACFATVIAASVTSRPGNYIAYFPSYQCLEQVHRAFTKKYPKVETVAQKRYMSARERDEFLSHFKEDVGHLRIGFCVLGGVFSEGVDLSGSRLIGSVIFGVGLPGLSNERNIIRDHFDAKSDDISGYDYAYTFPGMNNVLQAAGRVIRSEQDLGIVVLADDRYATPKYRALFPEHWKGVQYAGNASSLAEIIRRFWENRG